MLLLLKEVWKCVRYLSKLRPYMDDNKIKHISVHFNILSSNVDSNATVEEGYVLNQPTESHLRSPALKNPNKELL